MNAYAIRKLNPHKEIDVTVPASKSILNRALILAAMAPSPVALHCGAFSEDTRAMLDCLTALGIQTERTDYGVLVHGCGGNIPNRHAAINVQSAGTVARFLTALLAVCGGEYRLDASEQMKRRPMELLNVLQSAGVKVTYEEQNGHFPFLICSNGINKSVLTVDTNQSTQYASGLLMAASAAKSPFSIKLTGNRTHGSYLSMTLKLMHAFGIETVYQDDEYTILPPKNTPKGFYVEPDLSAACYFYALSLLFSAKVLVRGIREDSIQGDSAFLKLLASRGVILKQTENGLLADGSNVRSFEGFHEDMKEFSDQALTVAAIAPFASTPSVLYNIDHIRFQECDRITAITENLNTLGVNAKFDGVLKIIPSPIKGGIIKTYQDHRVAMAFALTGLKSGKVIIDNPDCCKKTFENYFELIALLTD